MSGMNREMIGELYLGEVVVVGEEEMVAYAEATGDESGARGEGGLVVAPPLFSQRLLHEVLEAAFLDERLNADVLRLVHGEQDMRFHRALRPGDRVQAHARVEAIEDKSTGQLLVLEQWLVCEGEMVTESTSGLFVRAPSGGVGERAKKAAARSGEGDESARREVIWESSYRIAEDQPARYAEASGDHNPIHLDPEVAKRAGLPGVILHGMCTMAVAGNAIIEGVLGGDSRGLKRLKVRFARPVLPGQVVTTRVWEQEGEAGGRVLGFEAVNEQGVAVLKRGLAEVAGGG